MGDWTKRFGLKGKHALVTGASKGIGLETCKVLADAGADIAAVGRDRHDATASRRWSWRVAKSMPSAQIPRQTPMLTAAAPGENPSSTCTRIPSTIQVSGFSSATRWYQPDINCTGKNALDRNNRMKTSGKNPCTASG